MEEGEEEEEEVEGVTQCQLYQLCRRSHDMWRRGPAQSEQSRSQTSAAGPEIRRDPVSML